MQNEKEFLKNYDITEYERPSVTADIVAFAIRHTDEESYRRDPDGSLCVLLIRRGGHPFKGCWALPGGFLQPGETVEECAFRENTEETGIQPASLMPVGVFSRPGRDPRGWIVSNAFVSILSEVTFEKAGDDAAEAQWFNIGFDCGSDGVYRLNLQSGTTEITALLKKRHTKFGSSGFEIIDGGSLAFDHAEIIAAALSSLRSRAADFDAIFDFLPECFTLSALQRVQEIITDIAVLPANFRRKVADYVVETDGSTSGAGHRPAKLYKRKEL